MVCRQTVGTVNRGEKCQTIIQGVSLVILLIAIFCFSIVVADFGRLNNIETDQEGFLPALSKVPSLSLLVSPLSSEEAQQHVVGDTE